MIKLKITTLFVGVFCLFCFWNSTLHAQCQNSAALDKDQILFNKEGGTENVIIQVPTECLNANIRVYNDLPEWIEVSIFEHSIRVTCKANNKRGAQQRNAAVYLSVDGELPSLSFLVTQEGEVLSLPCAINGWGEDIIVEPSGGTYNFNLQFSADCATTFVFDEVPSWLTVTISQERNIEIICAPLITDTATKRVAKLIGRSIGGKTKIFIYKTITQLSECNILYSPDKDGDGYGDMIARPVLGCNPPEIGWVDNGLDCDDNDKTINPETVWYLDKDGDGYGNPNSFLTSCTEPEHPKGYSYVRNNKDCNDNDNTINPETVWYADPDGDELGDPDTTKKSCLKPSGYVRNNNDTCPIDAGPSENNGCPTEEYESITLSNENYTYTRTYQKEMIDENGIALKKDIKEKITYFDGLGRPVQKIDVRQSRDFRDIVTHIDYNVNGRKEKEYLSFVPKGLGHEGEFRTGNVELLTQQYYQTNYPKDFSGIIQASNINAYSQKQFETSPLSRVLKQAAPGKAWKLGNGHEIKYDYQTNTANEVRLFKVNFVNNDKKAPKLIANTSSYYGAGELYKTITKDENWTGGKNHTIEEFKDKQERVILKRTYSAGIPHDTYFVYDDFDNLAYVIPPKVNPVDGISTTELNELCFQYKYDRRNRIIEKKLPGKDWEYIIYNKLDQPVLRQDPVLENQNQWLLTKYDLFGRTVYTGLITNTSHPDSIRNTINDATQQYESRMPDAQKIGDTDDVYYSNNSKPQNITKLYTINYFDTYIDTDGLNVPSEIYGQPKATNTTGLQTVNKTRVLGTNHWITTITGYDKEGQIIYTASKNPYLNTTDIVEHKLDFSGNILKTKNTHIKGNNSPIITIDRFEYDHTGRLKRQFQCIGEDCEGESSGNNLTFNEIISESKHEIASNSIVLKPGFHVTATDNVNFSASISPFGELIVENIYDNLGQLITKKVGNTQDKPLQTIDYTYNVRGWLKQINSPSELDDDLFAFKIGYNEGNTPLYNGNITMTQWKTKNLDQELKTYNYTYDALSRIKTAINSDNNYSLLNVNYDKNGNITALKRNGHTNSNATSFGLMDNLTYTHNANGIGNKLVKVTDNSNKTYGFKDGTNTNNDYTYDPNGNLKTDVNKGIIDIAYYHLNLPSQVSFGTNKIFYIYDASGVKLKKMIAEGSSVTTTEYAGKYIYENGELRQFSIPEGYVEPDSNQYRYVYQYKDHLGNVRLSFSDLDGNGSINPVTEILRELNYYPFGLEHKGYNNIQRGLENNYQTYQGKEQQKELGLNWHDFEARNYMGEIGRWMSIDPLAEEFPEWSPYVFTYNNPIKFIDPEGKAPFGWMYNNPIYDLYGNFLGTDEYGLQGEAIIYNGDFIQGMSQSDILEGGGQFLSDYASSLSGGMFAKFNDPTWNKVFSHSYDLKGRPDYDGVLNLSEANAWARSGNGKPLFVDVGKIDLSTIDMGDFRNKQGFYRTSGYFNFINPLQPDYFNKSVGEVYGSIKITVLNPNGEVRLGRADRLIDVYNFEQHKGSGAKIWMRNQLTKFGKYNATVNGRYNITDFSIYGYGKAYINDLGGY